MPSLPEGLDSETNDFGFILIVDDNSVNLSVLANLLEYENYPYRLATNGQGALRVIEDELPALILLDIQMPGMDGFALCDHLKNNPATASIPIIFMTAASDLESKAKGFALGAVDYVTKPFQEVELLARIKTHLQLYALTQNLETRVLKRTTELRASEARQRKLFELSPIGLSLCRMDGSLVDVNPAYASIIGRTIPETFSLKSWDITPSAYASEEASLLESLEQTGHYGPYEKEYLHKEGHLVPVRLSGILIKQDGENFIWSSVEDISDRKRSEQQLRELSERLELAMDSAQIGVWEWDYKQQSLSWDERMFTIFGLQPDDFQGTFQDWEKCVHPDDLEHANKGVFPTVQSQDSNQQSTKEYRIIQPDGKIRHVLSTAVIQWDKQGQLNRAIGMNLDITDQKVAEAKLKLTNEELMRATRLKDEFLANMSHELRTPLNAILGMTEGLEDGILGKINEKQLNALKITRQSGTHLLELINEILDLAKIESGQVELIYAEASILYLCESSLTFVKQQAQAQGVRLHLQIPPSLPDIEVDERRIRQVLINLLNNAVKFTPTGGDVTLTVMSAPSDETHDQYTLQIAIADTGIGIAPDDVKKLFQPFIQVDSALNRKYEGTGLGLALVKQIVELHNGNVTVTSEPNVGSNFMIELPYATFGRPNAHNRQAIAAPIQPMPEVEKTESLPLILLAEDNQASVQTISSYLEASGHRLVVAQHGEAAVELAKAELPDLILMDIQMPGMNGLIATQQIRQITALKKTPIIALTALAMVGDEERCLAAGADLYMSKPIRLNQLVLMINELLARCKSR